MEPNITERDLYSEIMHEGWHHIFTERTTYGVNITFIEGATAPFPGLPTRTVFGKDAKEAYRKFLAELREAPVPAS